MPVLSGSDDDMIKMGWSKQLVYGYIYEHPNGTYYYQPFYFDARNLPCTMCGSTDFTWIKISPSGVYWSCGNCRITQGPLYKEKKGKLIEEDAKQVTPKEAMDVMKQTGQKPSKRLVEMIRRQTRRPSKTIPPETKRIGTIKKKKKTFLGGEE